MAKVTVVERGAAIDPLKFSQPLGAALVFLGLARSMPIMHGSKGCASFAKALLTRHFNEPIPLQTTGITEVTAVVGSGESMVATLDAIRKKQRPEIIGLLTTGVTEVSGEDVGGQLRAYLAAWADADSDSGTGPGGESDPAAAPAPLIIGVSTPDFLGGLSDGWSAALEALVRAVVPAPASRRALDTGQTALVAASAAPAADVVPPAPVAPTPIRSAGAARAIPAATPAAPTAGPVPPMTRRTGPVAGIGITDLAAPGEGGSPDLVAVLAGPGLTAADLDELADLVRAFGLTPLLVPDLSGSVDGHLAPAWSPTTTGGTTVDDLRALREVGAVVVAGATASAAGELLAARTGAPLLAHPHLSGITETDALVSELMELTGRTAPRPVRRARERLADGLLDAHFVLGGVRVALAGEPDFLVAVGSLLRDVGAEIVTAVAPTPARGLAAAPFDEIVVGDLAEFAERAAAAGAELVVGSSHLREIAHRIGAAFLPLGFPIFDRLGATFAGTAGYGGSLRLLLDAANRVLDHGHAPAHTGSASTGSAPAAGTSSQDIPRQPRATADPDELDNLFLESPC